MPTPVEPFAIPVYDADDDEPISEVRNVPERTVSAVRTVIAQVQPRVLVVASTLRGAQALEACVTVVDAGGAVLFEGAPSDDGRVETVLPGSPDRVSVLLETPRSHRQAEVRVRPGVTEISFD